MNLNLKAATTAVSIMALLSSLSASRSSACAAEWHAPTDTWVNSNPVPVVPATAITEGLPAPAAVDAAAIVPPQAATDSGNPAEAAPIASDNPLPVTDAMTADVPAPGAMVRSPFVHSEPRAAAPFPLLLNYAVQGYVKSFLEQPEGLKLAFERSRPFLPEMIKLMKQQGIPDDLVYLTFAESDFSKRGKGPWQFTVGTAARFGLHVNKWIDERRDPILSTRAAAEYLAELHDQADNDWRVALIAWNTGAGNLERYWLLQGSNYTKFADRLPRRTRQLLNRFMAVAFIAHNAPAYGIGDIAYSEVPSWTTQKFKGGTLLKTIAKKFETTVPMLRDLNPALRADRVPPGERTYAVRIPANMEVSN